MRVPYSSLMHPEGDCPSLFPEIRASRSDGTLASLGGVKQKLEPSPRLLLIQKCPTYRSTNWRAMGSSNRDACVSASVGPSMRCDNSQVSTSADSLDRCLLDPSFPHGIQCRMRRRAAPGNYYPTAQ